MRHDLALGALSAALAAASASMVAAVQGVWRGVVDLALVTGALVTIGTAIVALMRTRPFRALLRRLVADPLDEWAASLIGDQLAPLALELERHRSGLVVLAAHIPDEQTRSHYLELLLTDAQEGPR